MSYVPLNHSALFDRLGPKFVQAALVNGEFFGETKDRAQIWLKEHKDAKKIKLLLWTIIATLFGSSIAAVGALAIDFFG